MYKQGSERYKEYNSTVFFVSVMYSNFSAPTTNFLQLIRNRERKLLCINRQISVLNSIFNKGGYTNKIQKGTRNTTVPVLFVSVMYSNFSAQTTHWIHNRKRKVLCIYCQPSVLNLICNKGGYTKEIQKGTRNTRVPVLFVSVVYSNFSARTMHWIHNRKRQLLCIYRQPSVLNSICNKGGYTKEIWKGTRNTTVTVYMVSFLRWKDIG